MHEHDELTLDDTGVSPQRERSAASADDLGETSTRSEETPLTKPARRKGIFALLAAVACTVFGAKLVTISALGSRVPLLDQWDGEAQKLYAPYLRGSLSFANLFAPHNEHRIFLTRLLALVHLELSGEWNTLLEMILCATVHAALITWLAALLMPLVAPRRRMLLACFVAFLFAFPIGYENTLLGFNFHFYLTLFFGIAALGAFATARPFSWRWFGGLAAAVLSYLSFASGVATILAAGVLVSLQLVTNARRRCAREFAAVAVMAAIAVAIILWQASASNAIASPWTLIRGIALYTGMIVFAVIPTVWYCLRTLARRPAISDRAWVVIGIAGWVGIQVALLAYGRPTAVAPRYMDILLLIYPVGLVAVFAFADKAQATRFGRFAIPCAAAWVFTVVAAFALLGYASVLAAIEWNESAHQQAINVQDYLATRNVDYLKANHGHPINLSYQYPQRQAEILEDPDVRAILPPELRPADADNAGIRNRLLLHGAPAHVTATVVHVVLSLGPTLLALGLSLFFAAGAWRGLSGARTDIAVT